MSNSGPRSGGPTPRRSFTRHKSWPSGGLSAGLAGGSNRAGGIVVDSLAADLAGEPSPVDVNDGSR